MKEQLIRELVKTGKDADHMNKKYAEKIKALEKVCTCIIFILEFLNSGRGCRGRDIMVVEFTTTCAISAYHHLSCEFESRSWRGVLHIALCDKVCHCLVAGLWFYLNTRVSSTNKTDITVILLEVVLNTITITPVLHI